MNEVLLEGKLNELIINEERRPDGSLRVSYDYSLCPSLTDQTGAHLNDLNYLIEKYKPDELAAYMAARHSYRQEVLGHDFSLEPSLQDARNIILDAERLMTKLPKEVSQNFNGPLDFLKFLDNPVNQETLIASGLATKKELQPIVGEPAPSSGDSKAPTA